MKNVKFQNSQIGPLLKVSLKLVEKEVALVLNGLNSKNCSVSDL
jgi:hypothetical protein